MAAKLKLIPGSTIRWGARRFVVVDYVGLDAVIAREVGKRIRFAGGKLRARAEADYQTHRAVKLASDNDEVNKLRAKVVQLLKLPE